METNGIIITDRIDILLSSQKRTRNDLYSSLGIASNSLPTWKARGTIPAADIALKIADYLNVSIEFLLYGIEKDYSNTERDLISRFRELSAVQQEAVIGVIQTFENQNLKNTKAV